MLPLKFRENGAHIIFATSKFFYSSIDRVLDANIVEDTDHKDPEIGMDFNTIKEAYDFYNAYARRIGFSIRIQRTNKKKSDNNIIQRQALVCSCEGTSKKIQTPQKKRDNTRFDCKAIFVVKWVPEGKYKLIEFRAEHSHDLVPIVHSHYLRSQRKIDFSQIEIMKKMHTSGIKQGQIFSYLSEEAGGAQNLNFIRSDCNNLIQRKRAEFFKKGDADCLLEYFKQKKLENKHFFYAFRTHENGEIRGVFFSDAKSRRDYGLFGDAICFDTIFRTNNYDMLCAPIVGINNHGQTTLFGCGLLDGETIDAITWLFTTFFEAVGEKRPKSIFTDQSAAISNVIAELLPETHHGLCLWHLCQNAAKNLSSNGYKSFSSQFKDCIYNPETIEEFEESWEQLLEDNGLRDNEWLQRIYGLRKKWAQVYSHNHFCAGMTTSQRSESINKFLKGYFNHGKIVLREFVHLYSRAMENRREKERAATHFTQQTTPNFVCSWSVEREASTQYTRKLFYCFQEVLKQTIDLSLELENDDGSVRTYIAKDLEGRKKIHTLTYNHLEQTILCTCRKFEFDGIICSHALKLFRHLEYNTLPSKYYLKRWSQTITNDLICDPMGEIIPNDADPVQTAHYSELSCISQRIVAKGSRSTNVFSLTKSLMLEVEVKIDNFIDTVGDATKTITAATNNVNPQLQEEQKLREPTKRRSKGQSSKRIKGPLETKLRKKKSIHIIPEEPLSYDRAMSEGISKMTQHPCFSDNGWRWMHSSGIHPHVSLPSQGTSNFMTNRAIGLECDMSRGTFNRIIHSSTTGVSCQPNIFVMEKCNNEELKIAIYGDEML
ncbi:hypothetical protein OROMI_017564 [Orobanche minor]